MLNRRISAYAAACLGALAVGGASGGPALLAGSAQAYRTAGTAAAASPAALAPAADTASTVLLVSADQLSAHVKMSGQTADHLHLELASTDAQIEAVNREAKRLDADIASTGRRLAAERRELRGIARAIYVQPDSIFLALAESKDLGDFMTRVGDLAVAGFTARSLVRALGTNRQRMAAERRSVGAAQAKLASLRQTVIADLDALAAAAAQAASRAAAPSVMVALPAGSGDIPAIITSAFSPLGQRAVGWALKVAFCESGYNPNAVNPYSGTEGLFQFMPSTWAGTPWGRDSPFDAHDNALAAAWLYQREGSSPWQCQG
ncbi:MAG: transglycosylase SLT domain-containing protein [Candidatus Dormibacterales bacterium]